MKGRISHNRMLIAYLLQGTKEHLVIHTSDLVRNPADPSSAPLYNHRCRPAKTKPRFTFGTWAKLPAELLPPIRATEHLKGIEVRQALLMQ